MVLWYAHLLIRSARREAATIPNQKRVTNPYESSGRDEGVEKGGNADVVVLQEPTVEWRLSYATNFKNLRKVGKSRR